jgi:cysteine desulfurase
MKKTKRVYLDYAAATPLHPEALTAMEQVLKDSFGNPSAVHQEGRTARDLVETARTQVARTVQVKPEYVTFTGGGTEANNLAILGTIEKLHHAGRAYEDMQVISTRIEHPATTESVVALAERGVDVQFVSVDEFGLIKLNDLQSLVSDKTVLISFAYANSEVGALQSLHQINKIVSSEEKNRQRTIITHIDAAQAPTWLNCQFDRLKADLVSIDFSKCGGPKGTGALLRSQRAELEPVLKGGGQEQGLRSGTENVAGIVGGAAAFAVAQRQHKAAAEQTRKVRDAGIELLLEVSEDVVLNGPTDDKRIPNNINISLLGLDTEYLTVWLDKEGFAVSTKSACSGAGGGESAVVKEMTGDTARASATLRLTLSTETTVQDLEAVANAIRQHRSVMIGLTQK